MYMGAFWEDVNSIYRSYICIFLPNLGYTPFLMKYSDVLRWTIIPSSIRRSAESRYSLPARVLKSFFLLPAPAQRRLLLPLARRQMHTRFHPLMQSALGIPNGAADFHIGRPVAPHPRLRQPGPADAQKIGRLSWGEQTLAEVWLASRFESCRGRRHRRRPLGFFGFSRHWFVPACRRTQRACGSLRVATWRRSATSAIVSKNGHRPSLHVPSNVDLRRRKSCGYLSFVGVCRELEFSSISDRTASRAFRAVSRDRP
jgi:hypothetical protein